MKSPKNISKVLLVTCLVVNASFGAPKVPFWGDLPTDISFPTLGEMLKEKITNNPEAAIFGTAVAALLGVTWGVNKYRNRSKVITPQQNYLAKEQAQEQAQ